MFMVVTTHMSDVLARLQSGELKVTGIGKRVLQQMTRHIEGTTTTDPPGSQRMLCAQQTC